MPRAPYPPIDETLRPRMLQRGFGTWIEVDGKRLVEYDVAHGPKKNSMTCWIASVPTKSFKICWRDYGGEIDSTAWIYLDGSKPIAGRFLFGYGDQSRSGVRHGGLTEWPFTFQRVPAEKNMNNSSVPSNIIGTITLKIKLVKRGEPKPTDPVPKEPPPVVTGPGRTTRIEYGPLEETYQQFPMTWECEPYDPENPGTFVSFTFRYRTAAWLISEGIMSLGMPIDMEAPAQLPMRPPAERGQDTKKNTTRARATKGVFAGVDRPSRRTGGRSVSGADKTWKIADYHPDLPAGVVVLPEGALDDLERLGMDIPPGWVLPEDLPDLLEARKRREARDSERTPERNGRSKHADSSTASPTSPKPRKPTPPQFPGGKIEGSIPWRFDEHVQNGSLRQVSSSSSSVLVPRKSGGEMTQIPVPPPKGAKSNGHYSRSPSGSPPGRRSDEDVRMH